MTEVAVVVLLGLSAELYAVLISQALFILTPLFLSRCSKQDGVAGRPPGGTASTSSRDLLCDVATQRRVRGASR